MSALEGKKAEPMTGSDLAILMSEDSALTDTDREYLNTFFTDLGFCSIQDCFVKESEGPLVTRFLAHLERYELINGSAPKSIKSTFEPFLEKIKEHWEMITQFDPPLPTPTNFGAEEAPVVQTEFESQEDTVASVSYWHQVRSARAWKETAQALKLEQDKQTKQEPHKKKISADRIYGIDGRKLPMHPKVVELAGLYCLDRVTAVRLNTTLMFRYETVDEDLEYFFQCLQSARNPAGLVLAKVKEMLSGDYPGKVTPDKDIENLVQRFQLDNQAVAKLSTWLSTRHSSRAEDIRMVGKHLENSNKPSARVMQMLARLYQGKGMGRDGQGYGAKIWDEPTADDEGTVPKEECDEPQRSDRSPSDDRPQLDKFRSDRTA